MHFGRAAPLGAALFLCAAAGACTSRPYAYTPDALRAELVRRAPDAPDAAVVPFELTPQQLTEAKRIVAGEYRRSARAQALLDAIFDPRHFGLRYTLRNTSTASDAIAEGEGNCLALASVFVGLARGVGLRAYYLDVSDRVDELVVGDGFVVNLGHITAVVETERGEQVMDFGWRNPRLHRLDRIDDVELVAHFHNNRGFEAADRAARGLPPDWQEAARLFELATRIQPTFTRAWNNLGLAYKRLGKRDESLAAYREALAVEPDFPAAHLNLGALYLRDGDAAGALAEFDRTIALEGDNARAHYNRGLALLTLDRRGEARASFDRALQIDPTFARAREASDALGDAPDDEP